MELAKQLLKLRKEQQWTQAFAAREIGIQQSYLSKLENDKVIPSPEVLEKLAQAYGVTANTLLPTAEVPEAEFPTLLLIVSFVLFVCSVSMWACAKFEIVYPQTYYTYQFKSNHQHQTLSGYHLTQEYLGEAAMSEDNSTHYQFVGERNISRDENRWLYAVSTILFVITACLILMMLVLKKRIWRH